MDTSLFDLLQCPACGGALDWRIGHQSGTQLESGEAQCRACGAAYPIRDGIGLFLTPDLPRDDLWEGVESGLTGYLRTHPEVERRLLDAPMDDLNPADLWLRGQVLEGRGNLVDAETAFAATRPAMYTSEYRHCQDQIIENLVQTVQTDPGPIVDLASGRGTLVEALLDGTPGLLVATDFSTTVLRRNRRHLQESGLADRVSLLAFDARRAPFRDGAVQTMTTFLGLPNISDAVTAMRELRRVVGGRLLAANFFYPEDDSANARAIRDLGAEHTLFREAALRTLRAAGWRVQIRARCLARSLPTPASDLIPGLRIDGLPVAETTLEWCVLEME